MFCATYGTIWISITLPIGYHFGTYLMSSVFYITLVLYMVPLWSNFSTIYATTYDTIEIPLMLRSCYKFRISLVSYWYLVPLWLYFVPPLIRIGTIGVHHFGNTVGTTISVVLPFYISVDILMKFYIFSTAFQ